MKLGIVFRGACDLVAISTFIKPKRGVIIHNECAQINRDDYYDFEVAHSDILSILSKKNKFYNNFYDSLFHTQIYNENTKYIVISLLSEAGSGVYANQNSRLVFGPSNNNLHLKNNNDVFGIKKFKKNFLDDYKFLGRENIQNTIQNLLNFIKTVSNKTIIIITGPTINDSIREDSKAFLNSSVYFNQLNEEILKLSKKFKNIRVINADKYIKDYIDRNGHGYFFYNCNSIAHYKRDVYKNIAKALVSLLDRNIKIKKNYYIKRCLRIFLTKISSITNIKKILNKKLYISVACHKQFIKPYNKRYLVYTEVGAALHDDNFLKRRDNCGNNISYLNDSYNELTLTYWMWKNSSSNIKGICHYRRFFIKNNDKVYKSREIKNILKKYDIIVPEKAVFRVPSKLRFDNHDSSLKTKDIQILSKIILKRYGNTYQSYFYNVINRNWNYLCNMFICKKELFNDYCEWLFPILYDLEHEINLDEYKGSEKRVFGLWGEYLFDVWLYSKNLKIYESKIITIEYKTLIQKLAHSVFLKPFYKILKKIYFKLYK